MIGIYGKHLLDVTPADKSHSAAQPCGWQLPLLYEFINVLTCTSKKNGSFRECQILLLLEFHHWLDNLKEIMLTFLSCFLCCRGTFLGAILLHSAVRGEHLAAMGTFSGLCHSCKSYWFNISFVVPLRKSSQVNHCLPLSPFSTMLHPSESGLKSVNHCNPSSTVVNSVHDMAKRKPRQFPAVEIHHKFIGNFRSNQKLSPKC